MAEPTTILRRTLLAALAAPAAARAQPALIPLLRLGTGPRGSGAERYGAALCEALQGAAVRLAPRHTLGSVENLYLLESGQVQFAIAGLETALAAFNGTGGFAPRRLRRLRVLAPVYGLPVLLHARPGPTSWRGLDGKRLGCGPAGGAGEAVVRALSETLGIAPEVMVETPDELSAAFRAGRLDALVLAGGQDAAAFGPLEAPLLPLAEDEASAIMAALPGLAPARLPGDVPGLAAWTLLLAQAGLAAAWAEPVAALALAWPAALRAALPPAVLPGAGAGPQANPALPWHPGAFPAWAAAAMPLPEAAP
jgi:TRAP-type uncharacterized transport system substrate-binding protein